VRTTRKCIVLALWIILILSVPLAVFAGGNNPILPPGTGWTLFGYPWGQYHTGCEGYDGNGQFNPTLKCRTGGPIKGYDIMIPTGTPLITPVKVRISTSCAVDKMGNVYTWVDTMDGKTRFGGLHIGSGFCPAVGSIIEPGGQWAVSACTGNCNGDHVHFTVIDLNSWSNIDAMAWLGQFGAGVYNPQPQPNQAPQVLAVNEYSFSAHSHGYPIYDRNMRLYFGFVSPANRNLDNLPSDLLNFSGSYLFPAGTEIWLNGVHGPYEAAQGMQVVEAESVAGNSAAERQGGGACNTASIEAETLAAAGCLVDPTKKHPTAIPQVQDQFSIAVSTTDDFTANPYQRNGSDVKVICPSDTTLEWKVNGDRLKLTAYSGTSSSGGTSGGVTLPVVDVDIIVINKQLVPYITTEDASSEEPSSILPLPENLDIPSLPDSVSKVNVILSSCALLLLVIGGAGMLLGYSKQNRHYMALGQVSFVFGVVLLIVFITKPWEDPRPSQETTSTVAESTPLPTQVPPGLERQVEVVIVNVDIVVPNVNGNGDPPPSWEGAPQPGECRIHPGWPDAIQQWCGWITKYAHKNGVEPDWVAAMMWQESKGNPNARSYVCATGLIQVMPSDGALVYVNGKAQCTDDRNQANLDRYYSYYSGVFRNRPTMDELYTPEFNIAYGTGYVGGLLKSHGSMWQALLYYGGVGYGDVYRGAVKGHYDCIVNNQQNSCRADLQNARNN